MAETITCQVWSMRASRSNTYISKLRSTHDDWPEAHVEAEVYAFAYPTDYTYIKLWSDDVTRVVWDSLSGFNVKGDPRRTISQFLQP